MSDDVHEPPARPSRRRRWRRRLVVTLVLLIVLPAILVQSLLWSDLPRRIIERRASEALGLRVELGKIRIGWFGSVEIRDLKIRQPDDRQRIEVPRVRLQMTSLPLLPFRQEVHSVWLNGLSIVLNFEDDRLPNLRTGAAGTNPPPRAAVRVSPFRLPTIWAEHASIELHLADGRVIELPHVRFTSTQQPGSDRAYFRLEDNSLPAVLAGSVVTRDDLQHEVSLAWFDEGSEQVRKQFPAWPIGTVFAEWRGRIDGGDLVGTLDVQHADVGSGQVSGRVMAQIADGVAVRPERLHVRQPGMPSLEVTSPNGGIRFHDGRLVVDGLILRSDAGTAAVDATADLRQQTGSVSLQVRDVAVGATRGGFAIDASLARDRFARPIITASGTLAADTPDGPLRSSLQFKASGDRLQQLDWTATGEDTLFQLLSEHAVRSWVASGDSTVDGAGRVRWSLHTLSVADAPGIDACGGVNLSPSLAIESWWLWSKGEGLSYEAPRVGQRPLEFDVRLDGNATRADVRSLWMRLGDGIIRGWGSFGEDDSGPPLQLRLSFDQYTPNRDLDPEEPRLLRGAVTANLALGASFAPLDYRFVGQVVGHDVNLAEVQVGELLAILDGHGSKDGLSVRTLRVDLLSGKWRGDVWIPREADEPIEFLVSARRVRLDDVSRLLRIDPAVRGLGRVQLQGSLRPEALSRAELRGVAEVTDGEFSLLRFDRLHVPFTVSGNRLQLAPTASRGTGEARLSLEASLDHLRSWSISGRLTEWPVLLPDAETGVTINAASDRIQLSLVDEGPLFAGELDAQVLLAHPRYRGHLATRLSLRRQRAEIVELRGTALGAEITGSGIANLERPDESVLDLRVTGLDAEQLVAVLPAAAGLAGQYDVSLRLGPPTVSRPTGPLEAQLQVVSTDASYHNIPIGQANALAHVSRGPDGAPFGRISIGTIEAELAGGTARGFARVTRVSRDDELRCLVNLELEGLQLEHLARAHPELFGAMSGRLDAAINSFGDPRRLPTLDLRGRLSIREARLSNVPALSAVFALANAGPPPARPGGSADASFRLEQDKLVVPRLTVFDRGTFLEGYAIELVGMSGWPQTELRGFALASARPLRDVKVPLISSLLSDVDEIANALQREVTAIRVSGTVAEPRASQASLADILGGIRWLFGQ